MTKTGHAHWLGCLGGRTPEDFLRAGLRKIASDHEEAIKILGEYRELEKKTAEHIHLNPPSDSNVQTQDVRAKVSTRLLGRAMRSFRTESPLPTLGEMLAAIICADDKWMPKEPVSDAELGSWVQGYLELQNLHKSLEDLSSRYLPQKITFRSWELAALWIVAAGTTVTAVATAMIAGHGQ